MEGCSRGGKSPSNEPARKPIFPLILFRKFPDQIRQYHAMKRHLALPLALLLLGATGPLRAQDAPAPPTWTNTAGVSIKGDFVKLEDETLTIRKDGKEFLIPMAKLSLASREQARKMVANQPARANGDAANADVRAALQALKSRPAGRVEIVPRFGREAKLTPRALGTLPEELREAADVVNLSVDFHRGLALTSDGEVVPWGHAFSNLTPPPQAMLGADKKVVQAIASGNVDWFLYADGSVGMWFEARKCAFAGTMEASDAIRAVKIAAFDRHVLTLSAEGKLSYFGQDPMFKLPPDVEDAQIVDMAIGDQVGLAVTREGKVVVWGRDGNGCRELPKSLSAAISKGRDTAVLVTTVGAACGVATKSGRVFFWGNETKEWPVQDTRVTGPARFVTFCFHSYDGPAIALQDKSGHWKLFGKPVAYDKMLERTLRDAAVIGGGFEAVAVLRPPSGR
jgi:hypothetical protein